MIFYFNYNLLIIGKNNKASVGFNIVRLKVHLPDFPLKSPDIKKPSKSQYFADSWNDKRHFLFVLPVIFKYSRE